MEMVVLLVFISALMNGDLLNNSVWLVFHSIVFSVIESIINIFNSLFEVLEPLKLEIFPSKHVFMLNIYTKST